jgi:nucleotide-binding universal stress UspA family protein
MFHRVLVPVDFTDKNDDAIEMAARLVDDDGLVTLIHVVQAVPGIDVEEERDFYARLESAAEQELAALGDRLKGKGVAWRAVLVVGSRAGEILAAAEDGVDLVVVSSHRVDLRHPGAGAGTLSYQIAIAAPCPVLLVK